PEELRAHAQALRVPLDDFPVVVDETDDAEVQRAAEHEQHEAVFQVGPEQRAHCYREQNQRAAHRRRAGLREVAFGADLTNLLSDALHREALDQVRAERERQHESGQRAENRARRQIAEDVEARVDFSQIVGDVDQHLNRPSAPNAFAASLARSPIASSTSHRPRAYSPISLCSAGPVGPSSAMFPSTRIRLPSSAARWSMAARTEPGFAL